MLNLQRQILVGKVDRGFEMGQKPGEPSAPAVIEVTEFARELTLRLVALGFGLGGDEVGDRLGPQQIELAVEKGAAGEFTRLGQPQPEPAERLHDGSEHGAAAMQMELGDILAGRAVRRRKP